MSFHLQISMQRDPAGGSSTSQSEHRSSRSRVATIEITGHLSEHDRHALRNLVEALAPADAETIVIDLLEVPADDRSGAQAFCEWVGALRREAKAVHVAARQASVYQLLEELAQQPEWLMPFAGSQARASRKVVTFDGPSTSAR